jgi:predicted nucleic acid-binding protein
MNGFLLDTNVISELIKARPEPKVVAWLDSIDESLVHLSVLTLGEIRKGIAALPRLSRRAALELWLETSLRRRFAGRILPVDEAVADRWGRIAGAASLKGKSLPVIDGLLAATALHHDLVLATRDSDHVAATGASVFNPW